MELPPDLGYWGRWGEGGDQGGWDMILISNEEVGGGVM